MAAYRAPGVQVTYLPNAGNSLLPNGFKIPCIIATGLTTLPVPNVSVTRGAGSYDTITGTISANTNGAVNGTVNSIVQIGNLAGVNQYRPGIDFAQVDNQVQWLNGGNSPTTGSTYYVTYLTPKPSTFYNTGLLYTSLQQVRNDMGNELMAGIITPITAAAKMCFDNGAAAVILIQAPTAGLNDLTNALTAAQQEDVDIMIAPQFCNTTLDTLMISHVLNQSAPAVGHERVWFRSADGMSDATTTISADATGILNQRITIIAPPAFNTTFNDSVYNTSTNVLLPSAYMGAGYAGVACNPNNDAATPLLRQTLVDVTNLSTFNYISTDKDYLAGNGVTVITTTSAGVPIVRDALTTDTTNVNNLTQSVVFVKDFTAKQLRQLLNNAFVGTKIDASTPSRMTGAIDAFLKQLVQQDILTGYGNINVVQDSVDPRTMDCSFSISVVYPLTYINIAISLVLL